MATQSIEVKDFTGGRNFVTSLFNLYPTEASVFTNISLDSTGMRTRNYLPKVKLLEARLTEEDVPVLGPIQVAPKIGEAYDLSFADTSYFEKVRFYQGERFIISDGVPYKLGDSNTKFSTVVLNELDATAPQTAYTPTGTIDVEYKIEQYTYFISYRSAAGFESPLEKINVVNGLIQWDTAYTTETPSEQTVVVALPPEEGDYGRIYRMGGNISYPSLVFQFDHEWTVSQTFGIVTSADGTFTFSMLDDLLGSYATTWGAVRPTDMRYLAATKYGLAASKGAQLYLSMNRPDAWSELSMLNFGSEITGIASTYRGFLVFTEGAYLYLVTGSSLASLDVNLLSTDVGCTSNSTIAEIGQHALVWIYSRRFYMFNGSSVSELEPNTYDWDYFVRLGFTKELTGISMYNKYMIGSDKGLTVVDLNHRYKPFIDYELDQKFLTTVNGYLREVIVDETKVPGAYEEDGSFWALVPYTYGDLDYVDPVQPTEGWGIGCYSSIPDLDPPDCQEDLTTCLTLGCYGGIPGCTDAESCLSFMDDGCILGPDIGESPCILPSGGCDEGGVIGLYPDVGIVPVEVLYKSDYYSPMFTFGDMNAQCTFSSVEVLYEGELTVYAYIDSREIVFKSNYLADSPRTARLLLPNAEARGNFLQVRLRFNGTVYGYRVNGEPLYQYSK